MYLYLFIGCCILLLKCIENSDTAFETPIRKIASHNSDECERVYVFTPPPGYTASYQKSIKTGKKYVSLHDLKSLKQGTKQLSHRRLLYTYKYVGSFRKDIGKLYFEMDDMNAWFLGPVEIMQVAFGGVITTGTAASSNILPDRLKFGKMKNNN